ncbi:MAG: histone deacetylase, partial [Bradyrhizobium sp.]
MKAFYSDHFVLPLPASHRFPMAKYRRLRERVQEELAEVKLHEPAAAADDELALAHDPQYVVAVAEGRLSAQEVRAIGFPWSPAMAERARRSVGATIGACHAAWAEGIAANLAGGTHHSQRARGAGYCVFNDVATAARCLQLRVSSQGQPLRVAIVDLDVHQGDGTAQITAGDDSIFTLS